MLKDTIKKKIRPEKGKLQTFEKSLKQLKKQLNVVKLKNQKLFSVRKRWNKTLMISRVDL